MSYEISVSVIMITYGHEMYIKQAVEGVLMQDCDFKVELLIVNDNSPDHTDAVVKEIIRSHFRSDWIKYTCHEKNKGAQANFNWAASRVGGKYIAICEGDDYWTDPLKLQRQVDFLEENSNFSFCFHDSMIFNQTTGESYLRVGSRHIDHTVDLSSVIAENNIPTASIVFRNFANWANFPDWFLNTPKGDYALAVILAEKGLGRFLPFAMSTYRIHGGGLWSGQSGSDYYSKMNIDFFNSLLKYYSGNSICDVILVKMEFEKRNLALNRIRRGIILKGLILYYKNSGFNFEQLTRIKVRKLLGALKTGIIYWIAHE